MQWIKLGRGTIHRSSCPRIKLPADPLPRLQSAFQTGWVGGLVCLEVHTWTAVFMVPQQNGVLWSSEMQNKVDRRRLKQVFSTDRNTGRSSEEDVGDVC